jgi:hypothetical protein
MKISTRLIVTLFAGFLLLHPPPVSSAASSSEDEPVLTALLHAFLAGASRNDPTAHDRFWSEQLVYTSSGGSRFGKAEIMQGLDSGDDGDPAVYTAEEIQIQQFGDTAVVAFRLVSRPLVSEGVPTRYFNTGTFVKQQGRWQAVAWQATRIPENENDFRATGPGKG